MTEAKGRIRVLVAEDSPVVRMLLVHLLESDPAIQVIGEVPDGLAAVEFLQTTLADVVLMDIHMPRLGGFEATRRIMESHPVPIVICSATADTSDMLVVFQAMEAGAIACIDKPLEGAWDGDTAKTQHLIDTVKLMSEVKVVRRRARAAGSGQRSLALSRRSKVPVKAVGMGASTGGPTVLQAIFSRLPGDFAAPILVVQHITPGFLPGLVAWLNATTPLEVEVATAGAYPLPGHVYLAPDDQHMGLDSGGAIALSHAPPENHLRPSVSYLFRSLVHVHGAGTVGVLLTGMGRDGATELNEMRRRGGFTIAQDEASSVVHGMPGSAVRLGAACLVLSPPEIPEALVALTDVPAGPKRS